jgi:ABC-2 type transport system ATP-binding protein
MRTDTHQAVEVVTSDPHRRVVLQVRGISKHFGGIAALTDVSFDVRAGQVLGLIGPNGAGKTTLFECLAGVLPVDRGGVMVDNIAIGADQRKRALFYVPDTITPWPAQSVRWALDFVVGFFGGPVDERATIVEQLGLTQLLKTIHRNTVQGTAQTSVAGGRTSRTRSCVAD